MYKKLNKIICDGELKENQKHENIMNHIKNIRINDIQTRDVKGNTTLFYMCKYNMFKTIKLFIKKLDLKAKHFQTQCHCYKDNKRDIRGIPHLICGYTELHQLCQNGSYDIILYLIDELNLTSKHFQNKDLFDCTELYKLCGGKCPDKHLKNIFQKLKFKAKHFVNVINNGNTELHALCASSKYNNKKPESINFIINSLELYIPYFMLKDHYETTALYWLVVNNMAETVSNIPGITIDIIQSTLKRDS